MQDPLQIPVGPITRARAKRFKEAFNGLMHGLWNQAQGNIVQIGLSPSPILVHMVKVGAIFGFKRSWQCGARALEENLGEDTKVVSTGAVKRTSESVSGSGRKGKRGRFGRSGQRGAVG
ncbi:hypothetical protein GOBAR_DD11544 [Gossypium barbadense]|nr:hypothetical protein GOBAR_DD11544 [Gossypium barbadense]